MKEVEGGHDFISKISKNSCVITGAREILGIARVPKILGCQKSFVLP